MARKGYKTATFTLPDGTRKYVYAKTQEELDQKVFDLKLQMKMGVDLNDRTTVGELIKMWYTTEVEPGIRANTADTIKSVLNTHLLPLCSGYVAKEVTPVQVKLWLNETGKLNKTAAATCMRALRGAFNLAEENGAILKSPVLQRYKAGGKPHGKRKALTPAEEAQLMSVVQGTSAYLLVWTGLAIGARRGELLALMWDCVDFDSATVRIKRNLVHPKNVKAGYQVNEYTKTEAGIRTLPLPLDLCEALKRRKASTSSLFVFPNPYTNQPFTLGAYTGYWFNWVQCRFGPKAKTTPRIRGIVTDTVVTAHVLRHTFATRCFEAGMDIKEVQYLMGHTDPALTLAIYTHYCEESRKEGTFEKARAARQLTEKCTTDVPQTFVGAVGNTSPVIAFCQ